VVNGAYPQLGSLDSVVGPLDLLNAATASIASFFNGVIIEDYNQKN